MNRSEMSWQDWAVILREADEAKKKQEQKRRECKHEWKSKFEFVYDYDHQDCHKCGATRMI